MRFREIDDRSTLVWENLTDHDDREPDIKEFTYLNGTGIYSSIYDVEIKNFHKRKANGEVFFNPMRRWSHGRSLDTAGFAHHQIDANGWYQVSNGPIWHTTSRGVCPLWHIPSTLPVSRMKTLAVTEAFNGVAEPEFQGLVSLGELRETLRMLKNPLDSVTTYLRKNRTKVWKAARKEQKFLEKLKSSPKAAWKFFASNEMDALSGAWLSGRYGIRPMVGELQDVMSAIDALKHKPEPRYTSRGWQAGSEVLSDTEFQLPDKARQHIERLRTTNHDIDCRAGVLYTHDVRDTWGMSLSQIPAALWELTPYSFMADWAANCGAYLNALVPKAGVKILGSWVVTHYSRQSERIVNCTWAPASYKDQLDQLGNGSEQFSSVGTVREINPPIGLAFKPEFLNWNLGAARYADAFLIARQLVTGAVRSGSFRSPRAFVRPSSSNLRKGNFPPMYRG